MQTSREVIAPPELLQSIPNNPDMEVFWDMRSERVIKMPPVVNEEVEMPNPSKDLFESVIHRAKLAKEWFSEHVGSKILRPRVKPTFKKSAQSPKKESYQDPGSQEMGAGAQESKEGENFDEEAKRKIASLEKELEDIRQTLDQAQLTNSFLRERVQKAEETARKFSEVIVDMNSVPGAGWGINDSGFSNTIPSNFGEDSISKPHYSGVDGSGIPDGVDTHGAYNNSSSFGPELRGEFGSPYGDSTNDSRSKETAPSNRSKWLSGIAVKTKEMVAKYDQLPKKKQLMISGGLIALGIVGTATGTGALVTAVSFAQVAVRLAGSLGLGRTVENVLRGRKMKGRLPGQSLSRKEEVYLKTANIATIAAAYIVGQYGAELFRDNIGTVVDFVQGSLPESLGGTPSVSEVVTHPVVQGVVTTEVSTPQPTEVMQAQGGVEVFSETITHVATGKNLSSIIANDLLGEMYSSGELASLTKAGKDNLIANIVTRLTPEQLQNIGLSSGDIKVIKPGEYLDIKKLAEFAKDLKITLGGKEMSLLERALTIK